MDRVIAVIGPTAVGKTKVSIDLARHLNTEIVSGDSMLVYRGLDVGTAKPLSSEQAGIPHHLIDIRNPDEEFSVADFKLLAANHISALNAAGKIPVLAGGTGLYVKALLEDYDLHSPAADAALRCQLEQIAKDKGNVHLHSLLAEKDPVKAASLHPNDTRRIIRALEIRLLAADCQPAQSSGELCYDSLVIGLTMERNALYERINQRVNSMVEHGLISEVKGLMQQGVPLTCQAMQAIGYKEAVSYIMGEHSLDQAVESIKQATRHFAKRQMTWYRKMPYITWIEVDSFSDHAELMGYIYNLVAEKFGIE